MDLPERGAFVRSRRARIRPSDVGLPSGPRRRVPGLRRDEVATPARTSVDCYIELERGRGTRLSSQMLTVLTRLDPTPALVMTDLAPASPVD